MPNRCNLFLFYKININCNTLVIIEMIIPGQIDNRTSEEENVLFSGKKTLRLCKEIERTPMRRKSDE